MWFHKLWLTVRNSFVYLNGGYVKVAGSALPPS